ncbi:sensor histidine kinase [Rhizosphaericola mali]|uniref:histidine kinase n=1 Tax=Rhizosphaericola mali TaxID=2545455 RepID=A0A5P2GAK5_9BACT|nr:sensor histidine kinase [Rhizosphaericola mali]QES88581.1 hypothetical protein E0W69_007875 [Rhizosphaericola mali]
MSILKINIFYKIFFLTFILSLFGNKGIFSQSYYFKHNQVEKGLSNNTVFCCIQDKDGFIWMGTKDGLNRYDGNEFKIYHNFTYKNGQRDNYIRTLYLDNIGIIYIGTRTGVFKYQKEDNIFTPILFTGEEINDLKKDSENNLWIISNHQLFRIKNKTIKRYSNLDHLGLTSLCIDKQGVVWISTDIGILKKWNSYKDTFEDVDLFPNKNNASDAHIEKLYTDSDGKIWIGTASNGIVRFDPQTHTKTTIDFKDELLNHIYVRDFIEYDKYELWIATEYGIVIYNTQTKKSTHLYHIYGNDYSLASNAIYCLLKDAEGGVWIGSYFGGVDYYNKRYSYFEKYFVQSQSTNISGNIVREIVADYKNNLWIGTEDGGLNKLDINNHNITQLNPSKNKTNLSYFNIHGLLPIGSKLYVGTFEHGLDVLNINTNKILEHYNETYGQTSLMNKFFVCFAKLSEENILCGMRYGLYIFNTKTKKINPVSDKLQMLITSILVIDQNNIWIGTYDKGLYHLNMSNKEVNPISLNHTEIKQTYIGITSLTKDSLGNVWVGTEGEGMFILNSSKSNIKNISQENGLPSNSVYKIILYDNENIWLSTAKGLVNLDPRNYHIKKIYTMSDGLLSDQFNYNSGHKAANGKLYFGSVKGLISFDPNNILNTNYQAPIQITNISINGHDIPHSNSLEKNKRCNDSILLTHQNNSISINYSSLSYISPEKINYRYKLIGSNKNWQYLRTNQTINFSALPTGNYIFYVQATSDNANWNNAIGKLYIQILPTFWQSPIAIILYFLVSIAIIVVLIFFYHIKTIKKNNKKIKEMELLKEKEIYERRIDFLVKFAHEIRTPLTLIKAPLEKIKSLIANQPKVEKQLQTMERNTERIISISNELLDFRKVEVTGYQLHLIEINIVPLIESIISSFFEIAKERKIEFSFKKNQNAYIIKADKEAIQKIITNLLENAIKYSNSIVEIKLYSDIENKIYISFKNDGDKIPIDQAEKIFEPYYRLSNNKHITGTGLGLAISKSLSILQKGQLTYDTKEQVFNIFILTFPLSM